MTLQELLNAEMDFASLADLARQGLAWWLDELTAMLPPAWRERLSSRPGVWIEAAGTGGWRQWKDGRLFEGTVPPAGGAARVGLLAPPEAVLIREIAAPRMPVADVRRMVELDIDRISPLAPGLAHFDIEIIDRGDGDRRQTIAVAILPRATAARLVAQARGDGYEPAALALRGGAAGDQPRFNFLPQALSAEGAPAPARARSYLWLAAVALIVVNVAVLVGRDEVAVDRLREAAETQQPMVQAALRLRRRIESEDARRRDLLARGVRGDPLRMLEALTQALPPGAWVQHLEWSGQTLHIVGYSRPDIDMAAAIRGSGAFANPRVLTSIGPVRDTGAMPFDITADARPEPGR